MSTSDLVERALGFHTLSIADLVGVFEDSRPEARGSRREVLALLAAHPRRRNGLVVGVTGTPGSGKSTLLGKLALAIAGTGTGTDTGTGTGTGTVLSVAVLAVDPSSTVSGGSLLGDRIRVRFPANRPELYFRSQASENELGGLGPDTFQVCRLLHFLFDVVFVETVGIGQSEQDVRGLADRMYLVLQPLAGDEIQLLKAGVLEVPDAIIVNKCDEERAARRLVAALEAALPISRPFGAGPPPVWKTSARTGMGIAELAADVLAARGQASGLAGKEAYFFRKWVRSEWGKIGERFLDGSLGDAAAFVAKAGDLESAEDAFTGVITSAAPWRGRST